MITTVYIILQDILYRKAILIKVESLSITYRSIDKYEDKRLRRT